MKRWVLLALGLILSASGLVPAASAGGDHQKPKITLMRWKNAPVTTSSPECEEQGTCEEEILILKAHDPDSSITEVEVWFDENGDRAPFVFAHTACVQGTEPGTPARLEIGTTFTEPGEYVVAAVAHSHARCSGHEGGDGHPALHSRITRLWASVSDGPPKLRFLLDRPLVKGGETRVRLQNTDEVSYTYNSEYEACQMAYRDGAGRRFLVPEGTHCDLVVRAEIGPDETVTLFNWDLDKCVRDEWGCVKARDLKAGWYSMRGRFRPTDGGDAVTVTEQFRIRRAR